MTQTHTRSPSFENDRLRKLDLKPLYFLRINLAIRQIDVGVATAVKAVKIMRIRRICSFTQSPSSKPVYVTTDGYLEPSEARNVFENNKTCEKKHGP